MGKGGYGMGEAEVGKRSCGRRMVEKERLV